MWHSPRKSNRHADSGSRSGYAAFDDEATQVSLLLLPMRFAVHPSGSDVVRTAARGTGLLKMAVAVEAHRGTTGDGRRRSTITMPTLTPILRSAFERDQQLDRVLGGGMNPGIAGAARRRTGIGKSTLLLQAAAISPRNAAAAVLLRRGIRAPGEATSKRWALAARRCTCSRKPVSSGCSRKWRASNPRC